MIGIAEAVRIEDVDGHPRRRTRWPGSRPPGSRPGAAGRNRPVTSSRPLSGVTRVPDRIQATCRLRAAAVCPGHERTAARQPQGHHVLRSRRDRAAGVVYRRSRQRAVRPGHLSKRVSGYCRADVPVRVRRGQRIRDISRPRRREPARARTHIRPGRLRREAGSGTGPRAMAVLAEARDLDPGRYRPGPGQRAILVALAGRDHLRHDRHRQLARADRMSAAARRLGRVRGRDLPTRRYPLHPARLCHREPESHRPG